MSKRCRKKAHRCFIILPCFSMSMSYPTLGKLFLVNPICGLTALVPCWSNLLWLSGVMDSSNVLFLSTFQKSGNLTLSRYKHARLVEVDNSHRSDPSWSPPLSQLAVQEVQRTSGSVPSFERACTPAWSRRMSERGGHRE